MSQRAPLISYEQPQRERERSYNQPSDLWPLTSAFDELPPTLSASEKLVATENSSAPTSEREALF